MPSIHVGADMHTNRDFLYMTDGVILAYTEEDRRAAFEVLMALAKALDETPPTKDGA